MIAINLFLTWFLWRQYDDMIEIDRPLLAWFCLLFSAANGAVVLAEIF